MCAEVHEPVRIAVGMSGGVDSSVAAALLNERHESVFGIMLRLWNAGPNLPNRCCSPKDVAAARRVATRLGIPFHVIDVSDRFKEEVVDFFIEGYQQGITPNPCMECNRTIRWQVMLDHARRLGATHLATGHYARIQVENGRVRLLRAQDPLKDQSYVLSVLNQDQLQQSLFPLGAMTKDEVRQVAQRFDLPVARKSESQDLCFVSGMDYRRFLEIYGHSQFDQGPICRSDGTQIGVHPGLANFTIGQRKGIGVSYSEPLYVLDKETDTNTLIVGTRDELGLDVFHVADLHWVLGEPPSPEEKLQVQIRYKAPLRYAQLLPSSQPGVMQVNLEESLPDITPGQSAVFYRDQECLGRGVIQQ